MAEWMSGPRQITRRIAGQEVLDAHHLDAVAVTGLTRPEAPVTCAPTVPIISGTFGPMMSASSRYVRRRAPG